MIYRSFKIHSIFSNRTIIVNIINKKLIVIEIIENKN